MNKIHSILKSISILASPAELQIEYLRKIGHIPPGINLEELDKLSDFNVDEIGLQFGDVEVFFDEMLCVGKITEGQLSVLSELSDLILKYNNDQHFWTLGSLRNDLRWAEIREKATYTLACFVKLP